MATLLTAPAPQMIQISGLSLAIRIGGPVDGMPIIMLHGWGADGSLIWPLAEKLAPLGYRVYVLDLPGFGSSPEPEVAWTVFDYAKLVIAYADSAQIEQFTLFGHSFGGRLGLILGAEYDNRVTKLILADSAGIRPKTESTARLRLSIYKRIRDGLRTLGLASLSEALRTWYNNRYGSADFNATSGTMRQTFVNVVNEDLLSYAARIQAPTLLLWGDQDIDTPIWQAHKLENTIPDAGLVVFAGAGHYSYLDALVESVRVIDYFLKQG